MRELDGYIYLKAEKIIGYCERTIKHVDETQKFDDQEFKDWAISYFKKKCRQKWWQFWRRPQFKNLKDFNRWWYKHSDWTDTNYRAPSSLTQEDAKAFAKVSVGFDKFIARDDMLLIVVLLRWYPSNYGSINKEFSKKLLEQVKKLNPYKEWFISIKDFELITKYAWKKSE